MVNHQPESPISWVKCLKQHLFFPSRTYTGQTSKSNLAEPDEEQKVRFDHDQWTNHDNHDWLVINLRWVFQMILAKGAIPNNQSSQQQNAPTFRVSQPTPAAKVGNCSGSFMEASKSQEVSAVLLYTLSCWFHFRNFLIEKCNFVCFSRKKH